MKIMNAWATKAGLGLFVLALSLEVSAATVIPDLSGDAVAADLEFVDPVQSFATMSSPINSTLNTAGIGVATFTLATGRSTAAITIDPRPPTPLGIPANNYELELWTVDGSGNFGTQVGSSFIGSDESVISGFFEGLVSGTVYAIVVGTNALAGSGAVDLVRFDSVDITVPVPAALVLFIGGLGGLVGWRRRQGAGQLAAA